MFNFYMRKNSQFLKYINILGIKSICLYKINLLHYIYKPSMTNKKLTIFTIENLHLHSLRLFLQSKIPSATSLTQKNSCAELIICELSIT